MLIFVTDHIKCIDCISGILRTNYFLECSLVTSRLDGNNTVAILKKHFKEVMDSKRPGYNANFLPAIVNT